MFAFFKQQCWQGLAVFLRSGSRWIRRRPSSGSAEGWRAVEFTYSHFGEDIVVLRLLQDVPAERRGIYVDVGAFDPVLHSNTYLLYLHGWRGLNIDASAARLAKFDQARPGDVNVVAAVSDASRDVLFLEYPTSGTSRVIPAEEPARRSASGEEPISINPQRTQLLTTLLDQNCPGTSIDFLNIDCEGLDLAVLRGLDWSRWSPRVIAAEANTPEEHQELVAFLLRREYRLVSQHLVTLIFLHESARAAVPASLWPPHGE